MAKKQTLTQREKFARAARDLGTDDNEKRFNERLGKIAKQKPTPTPQKNGRPNKWA
ncbi:hypothetical protein [Bradyrhizobium sp. 27S5]|uniref:hypothetical protein n=1 Tax=Bradyrhizobium sp. 27S5 TaxID=3139728 RepID=UPI0030D36C41